ncbi:galactosyltransferase-related protein [Lutibacter flavus]|uniref:Glycosyltransferase involved in cell wall bisynthesis n=1 Tax=Lutibacter flavus TaxID=691689 RepID=A0A238VQP8_9FLAO|nr:galactosyltransferase-related protein [Lutibacter flavus]SNR36556.1 Glycosyltransferase involved in cell wall bisynthesis [Lutibacter flavus]
MITLVFTYKNRSIQIVEKCLNSLQYQSNINFQVILVNYGSEQLITKDLEFLIKSYSFINYFSCPASKQLWNKSKAINIALKNCNTPYFFVGDIDMIFKEDFIEYLNFFKNENGAIYFQVGFLNKEESKLDKPFEKYSIKHLSNREATGMTLYPTKLLKFLNGYDEFYHGWGAEDTDVHCRLLNANFDLKFYNEKVLILHQWHSRIYRFATSKEPFHSSLEKINNQYLKNVIQKKSIKANTNFEWGKIPKAQIFSKLNSKEVILTNQKSEIDALLYGIFDNYKGLNLILIIGIHPKYKSIKNKVKKILGMNFHTFYELQTINNFILGTIIAHYRNSYYEYEWDKEGNAIKLSISMC